MKKLTYLFASLIMVALIVSCSKDATNDDDAMLKKAVATGPSAPVSYGPDGLPTGTDGIIPQIIPGANNGGNRTCAEVSAAFHQSNPFYCGTKIDYNNGAFAGAFPAGLDVTVTAGKYVSFVMDVCLQFGDKFYKVGAVIVKGSNAANVYYYPDGTMGDSGLASPINASGNPAGLSNLTFCFVECKQPDFVIALKSYLTSNYATTSGGPGNIDFVGYYYFVPDYIGNKIYYIADTNYPLGDIIVSDVDEDGDWDVTINNNDLPQFLFTDVYLFVGTLTDYFKTQYTAFPYQTGVIEPVSSLTIELNF